MKKSLKLLVAATFTASVLLLASCTSTKLYTWYDYQRDYYEFVKNNDKKSLEKLAETYNKIIKNQKDSRGIVPPGIYADYGYLLLEQGKTEEAKAMLAKEIELYPESAVFVGSILKRIK